MWIILPLLLSCSMPFISYFIRSKRFLKSSPSFLRHLDPAFIEWTNEFIHEDLVDEKHWFLQYPGHLFGCYPQVKSMNDDPVLLAQLTDMAPAHAFAYTLTRKLAESTVQFCACWLPICPVVVAAYSCKKWLITFKKNESEKYSKDNNQSFYNLKRTCMMLSLVPLSILMPWLSELAFGGILDYQKQLIHRNMVDVSSFSLLSLQIKDMLSKSEAPSLLHLFSFFGLYRSLYGDIKLSPDGTILCQQTELSLSYWSVLAFFGTVCAIITLALRVFVWQPVKKLCSLLTKDKLTQIYSLKDYREKIPLPAEEVGIFEQEFEKKKDTCQLSEKLLKHLNTYTYPDSTHLFSSKGSQTNSPTASRKSKNRQRSSKPESGDGTSKERAHGSRVVTARKLPVRPRYVSRGTFANLDSD